MIPDVSLWGQNPMFWTAVQLTVQQIHDLERDMKTGAEHILCGMHPISKATIVGFVVKVERKGDFVKYTIDDGTNVIDCIEWTINIPEYAQELIELRKQKKRDIDLGMLVRAKGKLKHKWHEDTIVSRKPITRELTLFSIGRLNDPNLEMLHWLQVSKLFDVNYSKPFDYEKFASRIGKVNKSTLHKHNADILFRKIQHSLHPDELASGLTFTPREVPTIFSLFTAADLHKKRVAVDIDRETLSQVLDALVQDGRLFGFTTSVGPMYGTLDEKRILVPAVVVALSRKFHPSTVEEIIEHITSNLKQCVLKPESLLPVLERLEHAKIITRVGTATFQIM